MIYRNITRAAYDLIEGANYSTIKHFNRSIKKGHYELQNSKKTVALYQGSALHTLILEPERFALEYAIDGPINPKTGESFGRGTVTFQKWLDANNVTHEQVISRKEYETFIDLAKKVKETETFQKCTDFEFAMTWEDSETGMKCKALVDFAGPGFIGDLKSISGDISPESLMAEIYHREYYCQAAWYLTGAYENGLIKRIEDDEKSFFKFIFAQKDNEKDVVDFWIGWESVHMGISKNKQSLRNFRDYILSDKSNLPGYEYSNILDVPEYARNKFFNIDKWEE